MKRLIEFPLENGGSITVEADGLALDGERIRRARVSEMTEKAKETFEAALEKIKPAATAMIAKLRNLGESPDEIRLEFGIKLNAEAGAVVASTGAEANFKVTLTWKREEK